MEIHPPKLDPNNLGTLPDEETNHDAEEDRRQLENSRQRISLEAVIREREYQRRRWQHSDQMHTAVDWVTILTVWLGKAASEIPPYRMHNDPEGRKAFRKRLLQLTAIGLAALEATDE
jgi:hypothetical protein